MADTGGLSEVSNLNSFTVVYTTGANAVRAKQQNTTSRLRTLIISLSHTSNL